MDNMIRKTINCSVVEIEDRILDFVGSSEEPDRMGDIVRVSGWKLDNYLKNPVFLWAHDYKQPPIGKCVKCWKSKGELKFRIEFAPKETYEFADTCYKLYKGGYLNAVSVGFAPDEDKTKDIDGGGCEYTSQELLELSGVPIPANASALVSARADKVITMKEYRLVTKPEETDDYIRIPVKDCKITATIDVSEKEGIKALYCGGEKEIATYLFAKDKGWTMEKAKKWVEDHKKELNGKNYFYWDGEQKYLSIKKEISQEEIKDEMDYLSALIETGNFNEDNKAAMKRLLGEICRFLGCDNPIEYKDIKPDEEIEKILDDVKRALDNVTSKLNQEGK